jgi:hypothetical protein
MLFGRAGPPAESQILFSPTLPSKGRFSFFPRARVYVFIASALSRLVQGALTIWTSQNKTQGENMKVENRSMGRRLLTLAALFTAGAAAAATTDSLTVTITPNAQYSVTVTTTPGVVLNLGTVGLNSSTQTVSPSTITVTSSYAKTNLQLNGIMSGTGVPWTFASNTASLSQDQLATWAVFTSTSLSVAPAVGYFTGTVPGAAGSNVVDTSVRNIGGAGGAGTSLFLTPTTASAGYKSMFNIPSNAADLAASRAHMWMYFNLPPSTTDVNAKLITFVITAGP